MKPITPMKKYSTAIRTMTDYILGTGFREIRLNKSDAKSKPWPHDDTKGVLNDHVLILKNMRSNESIALIFNYVGVEPSVVASYKSGESNDTIEESQAYTLEEFRTNINALNKELKTLRPFGRFSIEELIIATFVQKFEVARLDPEAQYKDAEEEVRSLYDRFSEDLEVSYELTGKAEESLRRARNTVERKIEKSELYKEREELKKRLRELDVLIVKERDDLTERHSFEDKKHRVREMKDQRTSTIRKYNDEKKKVLGKYPTKVRRMFAKTFNL